jgi:NUDIX domain-containing protein
MWRSLPGAGVLVVRDYRVLMVRHERSGRYRWELPSGLVDPGETFEQAAERETFNVQMPNSGGSPFLCLPVTRLGTERNHTAVPPGW